MTGLGAGACSWKLNQASRMDGRGPAVNHSLLPARISSARKLGLEVRTRHRTQASPLVLVAARPNAGLSSFLLMAEHCDTALKHHTLFIHSADEQYLHCALFGAVLD